MNVEHIRTLGGTPTEVRSDVAVPALTSYEAFKGEHRKTDKRLIVSGGVLKGSNIDISWLPAAAETYKISADPDDFLLVDIPIVTVDIPNRNMQAFPYEEVSFFDPMMGQQVYKSFVGKATNIDHINQDPLKAKGVHFDSAMEYIPEYNVWKIRVLAGFDRTKDPYLVNQIISGQRSGFSMGATVCNFLCSICGATDTQTNPCRHMDQRLGLQKGVLWDVSSDRKIAYSDARDASVVEPGVVSSGAYAAASKYRLVYQQCCAVNFFESSSVSDPADTSADISGVSIPLWIG